MQRQEHFWTGQLISGSAVAASTTATVDLVAPVDWVVRLGYGNAWLGRLRGEIAAFATTQGDSGALHAAIVVIDEDEASPQPNAVGFLTAEDVLWTGVKHIARATGPADVPAHWVIDVKSKRKLDVQKEVRLILRSGIAFTVSAVIRGFVAVK